MIDRIKKDFALMEREASWLLDGRSRVLVQIAVFVAGFVLLALYSVRIGALIDFDVKNYHYYSAYALLNGRFGFDYAPAQIQTFLNPLSFVPFYAMASNFNPKVVAFIIGGVHGLAAGLLFMTGLTLFSPMRALARLLLASACAALGVYGPTFIALLGGSYNNNLMSLFVLTGIYLLIRGIARHGALNVRGGRKMLLAGGALLGIAAGFKLVCLIFLLGGGIALLFVERGWRSKLMVAELYGLACIAGILVSRGYWMATLWSKFGNPVFPFYNKIFKSPYYYDMNFADVRFLPPSLVDALLYPFHFAIKTHYTDMHHHFRDARFAVVYVLIGFYLLSLAIRFVRSIVHRRLARAAVPQDVEEKAPECAEEKLKTTVPKSARKRRTKSKPAKRAPGRVAAEADSEDALRAKHARAGVFLLIFFVASYVIWQVKFSIFRYIGPLELFAPTVIAVLVVFVFTNAYLRTITITAAFVGVAWVMHPIEIERTPWGKSYFEVKPPKFSQPNEIMVIQANNRPWSYVIPFFQREVRFVGLLSNFSHPPAVKGGSTHLAFSEMLALVRAHQGHVFLMTNPARVGLAINNLKQLNISAQSDRCRIIDSKHEEVPICLLPLVIEEP